MVSAISGGSNDYSRVSGLVSGMDTESMIQGMLSSEKNRVTSLESDKQIFKWQQEAYQEIIDKLDEINNEFFDVLNKDNYILSNNGSKSISFSNETVDSKYVNILANSDAAVGNYTINSIEQLAVSASVQSSDVCSGSINGTVDLNATSLDFTGQSFSISLDGVLKEISFDSSYTDSTKMKDDLNAKLNSAFGDGRVQALPLSETGNKLSLKANNSVIQVISGSEGTDFLQSVGIANSSKNIVNLSSSVESEFGETENLEFSINNVDFSFEKTTSIGKIIDKINSSDANVTISYSSTSDIFSLKSKETGAGSTIDIENTLGSFFGDSSCINITGLDSKDKVTKGQDAIFYVNDDAYSDGDDETKPNPIKRSSNVFTIDNVTYTLKEGTTEEINYKIENNTDGMFEKITSFVSKFNNLYDTLNDKIKEKKYLDFKPLTDEQKKEMSDDEVKTWEEKAKSGLLKSDSILSNILQNLRTSFWDKIEDTSLSFKDIGITTSKDYTKIELEINETTLKEALSKNPDEVMKLFNKEEDIEYRETLSSKERNQRYNEVGFAQRIHDIVTDNITTSRNTLGYKGVLIEKAGADGDTSQYKNVMYDKISNIDKRIKIAIKRMNDREDLYWKKFSAMESALQRMNSQSTWFSSQFSQ